MSDTTHNPERSKFHLYSFGVAASNKQLESMELEVTPTELLNLLDGEVVSLPFESEVEGQRGDGGAYSSKVILDTAITALWLPTGSNRETAPDVRRGERVLIFRYADTDQFYWKELGWDDHLRRGETVRWKFSANLNEDADPEDPANNYYMYVSSHTGMIELVTSRANNEKAAYRLQLNLAEGTVSMSDDHGNFTQLESTENTFSTQTGDGTLLRLEKDSMYAYAPDSMTLIADKKLALQTTNMYLNAQTVEVTASELFALNTELLDLNIGHVRLKAASAEVEIPNTNWKGNLNLTGNFGLNGSMNNSSDNPATFNGPVDFKKPITANGITSTAPIKGPGD